MNKLSLTLLWMLFVTVQAMAQKQDLAKKFASDTTGFTTYPDTFLIENLKLPKKYKKLEINTWSFMYRGAEDKRSKYEYSNQYRYPSHIADRYDTVVLTKCDLMKCFTACWCPSFIPWYISAQTKNGDLITIGDTSQMKTFLSSLKNEFNAYLWLNLHDRSSGVPVRSSHYFKYKKVSNGFLISYRGRISNVPATYADMTYFVGNDFRIVLISKKHIEVTNMVI